MSRRMRAVLPMPDHTRIDPDAEITLTTGAPFKDSQGNVIGTITSVGTHPDGIEIEVEIHDGE